MSDKFLELIKCLEKKIAELEKHTQDLEIRIAEIEATNYLNGGFREDSDYLKFTENVLQSGASPNNPDCPVCHGVGDCPICEDVW